jgi:hypothetical protein
LAKRPVKVKKKEIGYKKRPLKHAKRGIRSLLCAGLGATCFVIMFSYTYVARGEVGFFMGTLAVIATIISIVGLRDAYIGHSETGRNLITCKAGAIINSLFLLILFIVYLRGMF